MGNVELICKVLQLRMTKYIINFSGFKELVDSLKLCLLKGDDNLKCLQKRMACSLLGFNRDWKYFL